MIPSSSKIARISKILLRHASRSLLLSQHACAVVEGGKIMAIGINTTSRIPIHAELNAIKNYKRKNGIDMRNCYIVIVRLSNGNLASSKPCSYCIDHLKKYNIKQIVYSTEDGKFDIVKPSDIVNNHVTLYFKMHTGVLETIRPHLFKRYSYIK